MSVVLAFNERAKSYNIFREGPETKLSLTLKNIEEDSNCSISASVNKIPNNYEYTFRAIASFETALGFLNHYNRVFLITVEKSTLISKTAGINILKINSVKAYEVSRNLGPKSDQIDLELKDLLLYFSSGVFYYSNNSDITLNTQLRKDSSFDHSEERFSIFGWNQHLLEPVYDLASQIPKELASFLLTTNVIFSKVVKGYFGNITKYISTVQYEIGIYTRIGKKKAGTRFNSRGLDDEGNVSIFGETEIIISSEKFIFTYNILRGSVPIFWEQQGIQFGTPKIRISRAPLATQPSFDRHFEIITQNYGLVHIVNLLSSKEGSVELLLSDAYEYHANNSLLSENLSFTSFDLNKVLQANIKEGVDLLFQQISRDVLVFGFNLYLSGSTIERQQRGIFRVNCLDCLDRTNVAQDFIARKVIDLFFRNVTSGQDFKQIDSIRIQSAVSRLFSDNGDAISLIYAGTGALKTSITRKGQSGVLDYLNDFSKSAYRLYCGNFTDKTKQETLDNILGINTDSSQVEFFNPISKNVQFQLKSRKSQYISYKKLNVVSITWNTGGTLAEDFRDYFVDFKEVLTDPADIYIVCLQEIVQLNATQIVSSDPERRQLWELVFLEVLEEYFGQGRYVSLASNQLVGTSLTVFINSRLVDDIKNVEICSIKTGLGGIAGNKGSVAVRFEISNNSFCIIGSHFTAGQTSAADRLREYFYILHELSFSRGKRIFPNDFIMWLGDLNFRNDCDGAIAKKLIKSGEFSRLLQMDQLTTLKNDANLFGTFQELPITFAPTYKYDPGTNIYDTSDKNRIPSWTDRILFSSKSFIGTKYGRIEIDTSDHKPVFLSGSLEIEICNTSILQKLEQEIYSKFSLDESEAPELPPRSNV